jgi:hypothetical protein
MSQCDKPGAFARLRPNRRMFRVLLPEPRLIQLKAGPTRGTIVNWLQSREKIMRKIIGLTLAAAIASTLTVLAQTPPQSTQQGTMMQGGMMQNGMIQSGMRGMLGMHVMPVTVTTLDTKTGLVDGTSGSMALKLHFPPASLAGVKAGDKLSVRLSFSKP